MCYCEGKNFRAELIALWGLLFFVYNINLTSLQVIRDSQAIVGQGDGKSNLIVSLLDHWKDRIEDLKPFFNYLSFRHVQKQFNNEVECISKKDLGYDEGFLHYELFEGQNMKVKGNIYISQFYGELYGY